MDESYERHRWPNQTPEEQENLDSVYLIKEFNSLVKSLTKKSPGADIFTDEFSLMFKKSNTNPYLSSFRKPSWENISYPILRG